MANTKPKRPDSAIAPINTSFSTIEDLRRALEAGKFGRWKLPEGESVAGVTKVKGATAKYRVKVWCDRTYNADPPAENRVQDYYNSLPSSIAIVRAKWDDDKLELDVEGKTSVSVLVVIANKRGLEAEHWKMDTGRQVGSPEDRLSKDGKKKCYRVSVMCPSDKLEDFKRHVGMMISAGEFCSKEERGWIDIDVLSKQDVEIILQIAEDRQWPAYYKYKEVKKDDS